MKKKTDNFSKFFEKKKKNGAIKEAFKQEKRVAKKERKDAIERHFEEKRQAKAARFGAGGAGQDGAGQGGEDRRPARSGAASHQAAGAAGKRTAKPGQQAKTDKRQPPQKRTFPGKELPPQKGVAGAGDREIRKPFVAGQRAAGADQRSKGAAQRSPEAGQRPPAGNPKPSNSQKSLADEKPLAGQKSPASQKPSPSQKPVPEKASAPGKDSDLIPLNKYIAHGGLCSRRDAAELIRRGKVEVNGQPVTEPGTRVSPTDQVRVNGKKVTMSRHFVYVLLNKPKDYITTTDDPMGRKTVLDLIRHATPERIYPVGRLDRNTSGVLLLTNDGDLAQKLAHPSHEVKKIYHVTLDKVVTKADLDQIAQGVTLDDGLATVDVVAYADAHDKTQIGLEIHSGRNRIVRRIFEHLGYDVRGLDRVMYAGLTKKNVQRGKWRLLTEKEIRILKYLNSSGRGAPAARKTGNAADAGKPAAGNETVFAERKPTALAERKPAEGKKAAPAPARKSAAPGKPFVKGSFRKRSPRKGPSSKA